ncbi:MAG: ABC transporter substrate-binding protein [Chloroflexi bacterium]|nr:ABC transporter substrate-binding protein [Chloroflexota bacterium]
MTRLMTRRWLLRNASMTTLGVLGVSILEACSSPAPAAPTAVPAAKPTQPPVAAPTAVPAAKPTTPPAAAPTAAPAAAAPTVAPAQSTAKKGGTVTLATAQDFPGMDPMLTTAGNGYNLHYLLWGGLTKFGETTDILPDLAEKWDTVDPRTFVFHLRKGARFHNNREVVADDVKASIERVVNPDTKSPFRAFVDKVQSVDVVDPYTVKVNLSSPNSVLPADLTQIKIMPRESLGEINTKPIGTGPYQFVEFVPGDHVTLKRFDGYWDSPRPYADQFIIKIVKDDTSLFAAFKTGQMDILWQLPAPNVKEVTDNANLQVIGARVTGNSFGLQVDCASPPFDNKLARQALLYATDKQSIFDLGYFDVGQVSKTNSGLPPNHWAFNANLKEYPFDVQKAKALFREAGVPDGYTLRYSTISGLFKEWVVQAEILDRSLAECGIKLEVTAADTATWVGVRPPRGDPRLWPNIVSPNGVIQSSEPAHTMAEYRTFSSRYNVHYSNPQVDALLDQGLATVDTDARKAIYGKLQDLLWDEVPWINTHHHPFNHAAWKHVKGLYVDGQGTLHFEGVSTEK